MSMNDSKGLLFGDGWLAAKEMWLDGCQSWVPMRIAKEGRLRRLLIMGAMARPPSTAREPFCYNCVSWVGSFKSCVGRHGRTGGQKSSCMSTTINAGTSVDSFGKVMVELT